VGFFQGYDDDGNIKVLGGNQSDSVSVQSYPSSRLLGFRRAPFQESTISEDENNNRSPSDLLLEDDDTVNQTPASPSNNKSNNPATILASIDHKLSVLIGKEEEINRSIKRTGGTIV